MSQKRAQPPSATDGRVGAIETAYLKQLKVTHLARARAAMRWRPKFLECLSMATGVVFAARASGIAYNTFRLHQRNDLEFAAQVREAEQQGVQLLYDRCFQSVIHGNLEPVYWQGRVVGHIRKYDNRLRIEFLRAHMPDVFKTPGASPTTIGNGRQLLILDGKTRARLQAAREKALRQAAGQLRR